MKYYIAALAGIILSVASTVHAADRKPTKPVVCEAYTIASTKNGGALGVCEPTREGGKPRYLRSFIEVKVTNPETGNTATILVGYP